MSCFRPLACLLGVGSVGLAMVAAGCGGAGNVTISDDGGGDGALDGTADGNGSADGSGGDGHPGTDGGSKDASVDGGKDGAGGDATVEGGPGEGGIDASEAGKDATGTDGTTPESSTEGGGVEGGAEAGPEAGVEAGPEAGVEAGPEAGVVCDSVNGTAVTVDPKDGQDVAGNGSGTSGGVATGSCAFKQSPTRSGTSGRPPRSRSWRRPTSGRRAPG